jgi:ribonuclease Y
MDSLFLVLVLLGGIGLGYYFRKFQARKKIGTAESKAERLLEEAKQKQKELVLAAKDHAIKITEEAKKQETEIRQQILRLEQRLEKKETEVDNRRKELENFQRTLEKERENIKVLKEELTANREKQLATLEKIAKLTREEARQVLIEQTEKQVKDELSGLTRKLVLQAHEDAEREARDIIAQAIERVSSEVSTETTTTIVDLPNEEMKGRIIGKEGRNIKAFEQMLGVEVIVDETPDAVVISGFNSVRRYVAKVTLEKLIKDGRIHPAKIEEAYEKAKKEVGQMIKEAGEEAVYELGITTFPLKLVQLIGRLKFRSSYGQNILKHSVEMAKMGTIIAEELGLDAQLVKQGALLHDIGKALDQEMEGTHVALGVQIAKKFNLPEKLVNVIEAHHGDVEYQSVEASVVDAVDNISGSRPGARKDTYEQYVKRLEELEKIANSFEGVEKSYAIQAGREIRVFIGPTKIDDWGAMKLAREIANKIQQELKFPGEIKVQVIREMRVVEYAR